VSCLPRKPRHYSWPARTRRSSTERQQPLRPGRAQSQGSLQGTGLGTV